ncbi:hypothetical protein Droror1_Dr00002958 [Drosera rotundifolia]
MSHNLTQDLIIEILKPFPVKTLLRFRSISKSFMSIIKSQFFIKTHVEFHDTNPSLSPPLLLVRSLGAHNCKDRYTLCKDNDGMDEVFSVRYFVCIGSHGKSVPSTIQVYLISYT